MSNVLPSTHDRVVVASLWHVEQFIHSMLPTPDA